MREAEYAATMASLVDPDYEYPKKVSISFCSMRRDLIYRNSMPPGRISYCVNSTMSYQEVVLPW